MLRTLALLLVIVGSAEWVPLYAQGGRLQRVREEISPPPTNEPPAPEGRKEETRHDCHSSDDDDGESIIGAIIGGVVSGLVKAAFEDSEAAAASDPAADGTALPARTVHGGPDRYFLPFPYAEGQNGFLWTNHPWYPRDCVPLVKNWSARLDLEESNNFDGLNRVNGHWLFEWHRLGLGGSFSQLDERLAGGGHDSLFLGDVNVLFRLGNGERAQARAGLGVRFSAEGTDSHAGINVTCGADFFPVKPLVVSALFDAGTLGDTGVLHGRATLGCLLERWEVFAGYDYLRIGSVDLQGPVLGLRVWF